MNHSISIFFAYYNACDSVFFFFLLEWSLSSSSSSSSSSSCLGDYDDY
ncbi:unnamed protein product [Brassica oleracea var. botrytis]